MKKLCLLVVLLSATASLRHADRVVGALAGAQPRFSS